MFLEWPDQWCVYRFGQNVKTKIMKSAVWWRETWKNQFNEVEQQSMRKKSEQQLAGLIKGCVPASTVMNYKSDKSGEK